MLLKIQHETVYRYTTPVDYTIQHLRLTPRVESHQKVLDWKISTPGKYQTHKDAYGNLGHIMVLDEQHDEIKIRVTGQVDISKENAHFPSDAFEVPLLIYLQPTRLTEANEAVLDLAATAKIKKSGTMDAMFRLIENIQRAVAYVPGTSGVTTTAAQVLETGSGVCQDHAHVFIACCRALDLPARYVSGYLHTGSTNHAASHAWADVWLETLGWVSFDVTHANFASSEHCRLAVGRDYLDACPVRGVRQGGGVESMDVQVNIAQPGSSDLLLQSIFVHPPIAAAHAQLGVSVETKTEIIQNSQ